MTHFVDVDHVEVLPVPPTDESIPPIGGPWRTSVAGTVRTMEGRRLGWWSAAEGMATVVALVAAVAVGLGTAVANLVGHDAGPILVVVALVAGLLGGMAVSIRTTGFRSPRQGRPGRSAT